MQLKPVDSSALSRVSYTQGDSTLTIEFPRGDLYFYPGVPVDIYADFINADSKGAFYRENICGEFESIKVPLEERTDNDIPDSVDPRR